MPAAIQAWFEPLLWIIGTITALAAFVRLCKPVWEFVKSPKKFSEKLELLDQKLDIKFDSIDNRFEKIEKRLDAQEEKLENLSKQNAKEDVITLSLLHDSILQIYQDAKAAKRISELDYYRACELYKQDGNSKYIDDIMAALTDLHNKGYLDETQKREIQNQNSPDILID